MAEVQVDDNKKVAQLATGAFTQVNNVLLFYFPLFCHAILKTSFWALFKVERKKISSLRSHLRLFLKFSATFTLLPFYFLFFRSSSDKACIWAEFLRLKLCHPTFLFECHSPAAFKRYLLFRDRTLGKIMTGLFQID